MSELDDTRTNGVVVFDLDGTLTDTSRDIVYTVNFMRERVGLVDLSKDEVLAAVGKGAAYLLRALLDTEGHEKETFEQLLKVFEERMGQNLDSPRIITWPLPAFRSQIQRHSASHVSLHANHLSRMMSSM